MKYFKTNNIITIAIILVATVVFANQVWATGGCPGTVTDCPSDYVKDFVQTSDDVATRVGEFGIGSSTDISDFSLGTTWFEVHGPSWVENLLSHSPTHFADRLFISMFSPVLAPDVDLYVNGNIQSDALNLKSDTGFTPNQLDTEVEDYRLLCVDDIGAIIICS